MSMLLRNNTLPVIFYIRTYYIVMQSKINISPALKYYILYGYNIPHTRDLNNMYS